MELTVLPICGKNSACLTVKAVVKKLTLLHLSHTETAKTCSTYLQFC